MKRLPRSSLFGRQQSYYTDFSREDGGDGLKYPRIYEALTMGEYIRQWASFRFENYGVYGRHSRRLHSLDDEGDEPLWHDVVKLMEEQGG